MQVVAEQLVGQLCAADLASLDVPALQAHVRQLQQAVGRLTGRLDQALGQLQQSSGGQLLMHPDRDTAAGTPAVLQEVRHWWRDTATLTGSEAGRDLARVGTLHALPLIAQAVTDGRLSQAQAAVLCRLHGRIHEQDLRASQPQLVTVAAGLTTDALGRWVRHQIATHCEPALEAEQGKARQRRHLQLHHEPDGTIRGRFVLAAEDAEAVLTVLEPLARKQGLDDVRSAGQRRADALVEVFAGAASWMDLPDAGGQRPVVTYVMSQRWAAGQDPLPLTEALGRGTHPNGLFDHSASGAWTGTQTRPLIEAVLCDARLSRLLLDPHGTVISLTALTDQITLAQRRAVSARDRHCVAKGCTRPPAFCDVHHLTHREHGGRTEIENLALLCRRHHVLWHRGQLHLHDLHTPWLPDPEPETTGHDPWDDHSPPLVA